MGVILPFPKRSYHFLSPETRMQNEQLVRLIVECHSDTQLPIFMKRNIFPLLFLWILINGLLVSCRETESTTYAVDQKQSTLPDQSTDLQDLEQKPSPSTVLPPEESLSPTPPLNRDSLKAVTLKAYDFPEEIGADASLIAALKAQLQKNRDYLDEFLFYQWGTYNHTVPDDLFVLLYSTDHRNHQEYGMMYDIYLAVFLRNQDQYQVLLDSVVGGRYQHVQFLDDWYWNDEDSLHFYFWAGFHEDSDTMVVSIPAPD